jgi:hypothetical protein
MAGGIKDVRRIELSAARLGRDAQEDRTTGEAVAGMLLHGLGCADRPLALPPQGLANRPVALRLRDGVSAEPGNRCTRGRRLAKTCSSGGDTWCRAVAMAGWQQAGMALQGPARDPTSVSLPGASVPETDTQAMALTSGASQDHRPDVPPAVRAWLVAQDGGVPLLRPRWDGHAADPVGCKARGEAVSTPCAARAPPRDGLADATCSPAAHAPHVARLPCMTRLPATWTVTPQVREPAWAWGAWQPRHATVSDQPGALGHDGMAPRGRVVSSPDAGQRAAQTLATAQATASAQVQQPRCPLQAHRWPSATPARAALETLAPRGRSPQRAPVALTPHRPSARTGRPPPQTPQQARQGPLHASVMPDAAKRTRPPQRQAGVVLGPPCLPPP